MGRKVQIKRGFEAQLPVLNTGEFGLVTDTKRVLIGNGTNLELATKEQLEENIKHMTKWINVTNPPYNAIADGLFDVTAIINQAITDVNENGGGVVYIPSATEDYMVDALLKIDMKSNVELLMEKNTKLKAIPNDQESYAIIRCSDIDNFSITGGRLIGERNDHSGVSGQWGFGISLLGASNFFVRQTHISDCWGDGVYIGQSETKSYCENGTIVDVICDNNRRQGISFVSGKNIKIIRPLLKNTNGHDPQAGIDFEPNNSLCILDCLLDSPRTENNAFAGILISLQWLGAATNKINIIINNHYDKGSFMGLSMTQLWYATKGKIVVNDPLWIENSETGLKIRNWNSDGANIDINHPEIINPNVTARTSGSYGSGICIFRELTEPFFPTLIGNININRPTIRDDRAVTLMVNGIYNRDSYTADKNTNKVNIIDPIIISGCTLSPLIQQGINSIISDKYKQMEKDVGNADPTINYNYSYSSYNNKSSTRNIALTVSDTLPIGYVLTVEIKSQFSISINLSVDSLIYPQNKNTLISNLRGSKITVRKISATEWTTENLVGTWA